MKNADVELNKSKSVNLDRSFWRDAATIRNTLSGYTPIGERLNYCFETLCNLSVMPENSKIFFVEFDNHSSSPRIRSWYETEATSSNSNSDWCTSNVALKAKDLVKEIDDDAHWKTIHDRYCTHQGCNNRMVIPIEYDRYPDGVSGALVYCSGSQTPNRDAAFSRLNLTGELISVLLSTTTNDELEILDHANRNEYFEGLHKIVNDNSSDSSGSALLFVDIDDFGKINETFGMRTGDRILAHISQRLTTNFDNSTKTIRWFGDSFLIVLNGKTTESDAIYFAQEVLKIIKQPIAIEDSVWSLDACIGIVADFSDYLDPDDIIRDSHSAMRCAKALGNGNWSIFDPIARRNSVQKNMLEYDLKTANIERDFFLEFHPLVSANDGTTTGFEALIRWQHPNHGVVGPVEFIGIAEDNGVINDLGYWVLEEAVETLSVLMGKNEKQLTMNVNISPLQLGDPMLVKNFNDILSKHGVAPQSVALEITEEVFVSFGETILQVMADLRNTGFQLFLDDFGTGYSSFGYLSDFRFDAIKLDRKFVELMSRKRDSQTIPRIVSLLAKSMDMSVVAEGIESELQSTRLRDMGYQILQGNYYSKPIPKEDVANFCTTIY